MKKIILTLLTVAALFPAVTNAQTAPAPLSDETLTYNVIYKWGFINKVAGYATMSLRTDGNYYKASLFAENAPWANSIYMLRDTLYTTMTRPDLYPVSYTYIAHEAGKYKKDVLTFTHTGNEFSATAVREKRPKGGELTTSTVSMEGQGMTVDMLSSFFYLRTLPFDTQMKPGDSRTVNIFSGSKKELLKITYNGHQTINTGSGDIVTYNISFTFTRKGVVSSAPIQGWITADKRRIPLKVEGSLSVGKVRAIYTGTNP